MALVVRYGDCRNRCRAARGSARSDRAPRSWRRNMPYECYRDAARLAEPALGTLTLLSEIPRGHPKKKAVEDAIKESLWGLPASWKAQIARVATWWAIRVEGPGFDWTLIVDPDEQGPRSIQDSIRAALRSIRWAAGAIRKLRRPRPR